MFFLATQCDCSQVSQKSRTEFAPTPVIGGVLQTSGCEWISMEEQEHMEFSNCTQKWSSCFPPPFHTASLWDSCRRGPTSISGRATPRSTLMPCRKTQINNDSGCDGRAKHAAMACVYSSNGCYGRRTITFHQPFLLQVATAGINQSGCYDRTRRRLQPIIRQPKWLLLQRVCKLKFGT